MKKVLVSDYDQTFYLNDDDIEKNKISINDFRNRGNIFVIATGRSYKDFMEKVNKYNIIYDYVILNHGATILDKDENILKNFSIDNNVIMDIKNNLQLEKSLNKFCCSLLQSRVDFNYPNLTKINVKYSSFDEAMAVNNIINKKFQSFVNSYYVEKNSVEIISCEITKSKAIQLLIEKLNISKDNVYTIGDGYSDIDMIKNYNGFAINGALEELKKYALKEYDSVSELVEEIR